MQNFNPNNCKFCVYYLPVNNGSYLFSRLLFFDSDAFLTGVAAFIKICLSLNLFYDFIVSVSVRFSRPDILFLPCLALVLIIEART